LDISILFFISSGLFLGWSLGANHAVNVFGTAVVSKMVKFRTAAVVAGIFVILGSVFSGSGTTKTLTELGSVNALAGSFAVALAVGLSVTFMTKIKLPVSTSQAVIGGIVGWNIFTGSPTDFNSLSKILFSWVASPVLAGFFGFVIFKLVKKTILKKKIHLLELDNYTRIGLIVVGALASYSLGANNIANVMGMFISAPLFNDVNLFGVLQLSGVQLLFLLGGLSIAVGIFTYGDNVMKTVGKDLYKISPITGLIVVLAEFLVLFIFTSEGLESFLLKNNLPSIPLVPLSTTQAFIGAVIGVGLAKDPLSINFKVFGKIGFGWIVAPLSAGIITFISLFFIQNVFEQKVINLVPYEISKSVIAKLNESSIPTDNIKNLTGKRFFNKKIFKNELSKRNDYTNDQVFTIFQYAIIDSFKVDSAVVSSKLDRTKFTEEQLIYLKQQHGKTFNHKNDFEKFLYKGEISFTPTGNKLVDKQLEDNKAILLNAFRIKNKTGL
jgi:inorganic phosphate transporter, PiT family